MKKLFLVVLVVAIMVIGLITSCSNESNEQVVDQVESKEVGTVEKPRSEIVENFDPENVEFFWVKDWNTPAFWSSDDTWDGIAYDGYFIRGTKVDSLVYFLYDRDGRSSEKYFYFAHLTVDPRNSNLWQQGMFSIPKDKNMENNVYDVIKKLCCIKNDAPESQLVIEGLVQDIEKLGLLNRENPYLFEIGIALVRYTGLYYGESLSYEQAARVLADNN